MQVDEEQIHITLNREERDELVGLVSERLAEISGEIRHTIVSTFHDDLKDRKRRLQALLNKLCNP